MSRHSKPAQVGILGGMGPAATADFYRSLVEATPAARDQDHLHVLIEADPTVPDRTASYLHGGPSPLPWLIRGATALVTRGATVVVMPCNTAHLWYGSLAAQLPVPVLHIVDAVVDDLAQQLGPRAGGTLSVGLLATRATAAGRLYPQRAETDPRARRWNWVLPSESEQDAVQAGIEAVKAARLDSARTMMLQAVAGLARRGVDAVVYACTEVPLALRGLDVGLASCDSTAALARMTVHVATGRARGAGR